MIILFAGSLIWLLVSRQTISTLNTELDKTKLKSESLLSEKLLTEKDLDKSTKKTESLSETLSELEKSVKNQSELVSTQTEENRRIKRALQFAKEQEQKDKSLTDALREKLTRQIDQHTALQKQETLDTDSIHSLLNTIASLEAQLHDAITRSIDQTHIIAEKRNNKLTSRASRTEKLVANVELPARLNQLSFVVEGPDGAVLSDNAGAVSVRQIASDQSLTASLKGIPQLALQNKKMEVVYKPKMKLKPGTYTIKIYNGSDYVGTMYASLR